MRLPIIILLLAGGVALLGLVYGLAHQSKQQGDGGHLSVRFHIPKCHVPGDGLVECTLKKLSKEEKQ